MSDSNQRPGNSQPGPGSLREKLPFLPDPNNRNRRPRTTEENAILLQMEEALRRGDVEQFEKLCQQLPSRRAYSCEWECILLRLAVEFNYPDVVFILLCRGWCNTKKQFKELLQFMSNRLRTERSEWQEMYATFGVFWWTDLLGLIDGAGHSRFSKALGVAMDMGDIEFYLAVKKLAGYSNGLAPWVENVCTRGDEKMLRKLLEKIADPVELTQGKKAAIKNGHLGCLKLLMLESELADDLEHLLSYACWYNQGDIIRWLVSQGANPNQGCHLIDSIRSGEAEAVEALLECGAKIPVWDVALYTAMRWGGKEVLRALLTTGRCTHKTTWENAATTKCTLVPQEVKDELKSFRWDERFNCVVVV